jgi:hypothetical protein
MHALTPNTHFINHLPLNQPFLVVTQNRHLDAKLGAKCLPLVQHSGYHTYDLNWRRCNPNLHRLGSKAPLPQSATAAVTTRRDCTELD